MLRFCSSASHRMSILATVVAFLCLSDVASAQTATLGTCIGGLSPSFEIPPINLAAAGTAVVNFSPASVLPSVPPGDQTYFVNFKLNQTGLQGIFASHIHQGNSSTATGLIVIEFTSAINLTDFIQLGYATGTVNTTSTLAQAIISSPGQYYVNIHTKSDSAVPKADNKSGSVSRTELKLDLRILFEDGNGAIRGQLGSIDINPVACQVVQSGSGTRNSGVGIIVGVICAGLVVIALLALVFFFYMRRKSKQKEAPVRSLAIARYRGAEVFSIEELRVATNQFSQKNLLGEGGFGIVYKGIMKERQDVAVKRAKPSSKADSFEFEVEAISHMAHANLIRLLGYCTDEGEEILVYEYAAKGSLQDHLHSKPNSSFQHIPLTFEQRLNIALGAAQGLSYLHNFAKPTTVHRDVKPANILLDANLNAKLADFGLLKSNQGLATYMTTDVKGTAGYLDPEYFMANRVTAKSDVFGFGVVLLELLTGREAITTSNGESIHIRDWASEALKQIDIYEVVDPDMGYATVDELESFFEIAFSCVKQKSKNRLEMQEAAGRLRELQQVVIARMATSAP